MTFAAHCQLSKNSSTHFALLRIAPAPLWKKAGEDMLQLDFRCDSRSSAASQPFNMRPEADCGDGRMPIRLLRLTICFNWLHAWFATDFSAFSALILQLHRAQPFTFRNWHQELGGASFTHASLIYSDERSKMSQNPLPSVLILDSANCYLVTVILTLTMLSVARILPDMLKTVDQYFAKSFTLGTMFLKVGY